MIFKRGFIAVLVGLGAVACIVGPDVQPDAAPQSSAQNSKADMAGKNILVFSKTLGWRHKSIPAGQDLFRRLAERYDFAVTFSENDGDFTPENLAAYDAVVFLNTTGPVLSAETQAAFKSYIQNGGGFVGVHSATDTHIKEEWPWFIDLVGGKFMSHPNEPSNVQAARLYKTTADHAATAHIPKQFEFSDEWYDFERLYGPITPLLNIDRQSYQNAATQGITPIAWAHEYDGGRSFYTNLGHDMMNYNMDMFERHILGGLEYAVQSSQN